MKQFWTPLARVFGMVDSLASLNNTIEQVARAPIWKPNATQWPELFNALRTHAEQVWCIQSIRHSEVNSQEILSIRQVHIQASSVLMSHQLNDWFEETDVPHLIQWMINGPFQTEQIKSLVDFQHLDGLVLHPYNPSTEEPVVSPYLQELEEIPLNLNFNITSVTQWQVLEKKESSNGLKTSFDISIEDGLGNRNLQIHCSKLILGAEKTVVFPDGQQVELKDQSEILWNNEQVLFLKCDAKYVSGIHLLISKSQEGFVIQDLNSTNGTFWESERLTVKPVQTSVLDLYLSLGGPFSDSASDAARVHLRSHPNIRFSAHGLFTPLRSLAAVKRPENHLVLTDSDPSNQHAFLLDVFPFYIGRDLDCQGVVAAAHAMVSRRHLIVLQSDQDKSQIQIQDVSRHGLTMLNGISIGRDPVWLNVGESILLGRTDEYPGLSLVLGMP